MAFEVISIGDGEMLFNAFNGVAMIFGSGNMGKLIISGFSLGIMLISLRYLTNQEFPLNHALVVSMANRIEPFSAINFEPLFQRKINYSALISVDSFLLPA